MAQASQTLGTQDHPLSERIDHHLDYERQAWKSVPDYASQWAEMEALDKEAFHLHWRGVAESYLRELDQWANEGRLSAAQAARYRQLREFVTRYRSTVEAMLA